jgi:hypothetical protein
LAIEKNNEKENAEYVTLKAGWEGNVFAQWPVRV